MDEKQKTETAIPDGPLTPGTVPDITPTHHDGTPGHDYAHTGYTLIDDTQPPPSTPTKTPATNPERTVYPILFAISFSHLLNDTMQAVIPSIYPIIKDTFTLSYTQIGLITLVFQVSAALLQPVVGLVTDRRPQPFSLAIGMAFTLTGLLVLSVAPSFLILLLSVALIGMGSSVFHPEASRIAYLASGGRRGFAQSLFQVGGNAGSAIGPLLAAAIIVPFGRGSIAWFSLIALLAITVLIYVGRWYSGHIIQKKSSPGAPRMSFDHTLTLPRSTIMISIGILLLLIFSKYFYLVSLTSYLTFYMIEKFGTTVQTSQTYLFIFLAAVAAGTFAGGPIGDRIGRKYVIWASILGAAPFTLWLPYASLGTTTILIILIGFILASAFSAILVYAQELLPGKVGLVSGLFFGFAFGMAGIGSAVLGQMIDWLGIHHVYWLCSFLPLIGLVTAFLPNIENPRRPKK